MYCIVLHLSIYIVPLNSHGQTEAFLVQLAPKKRDKLVRIIIFAGTY